MADDPFLERLKAGAKVHNRISKLLTLAKRHPDTEEGKSARAKAEKLAEEHGFDLTTFRPAEPKKVSLAGFEAMTGAIRKAYPGEDNEDYTKYTKKGEDDA